MIKQVLGILLMVAGVVVGLYVGGYIMLIGGIIQVIQSVTPVIIAKGIAYGIAKIIFAGFAGWLSAIIAIIPGFVLFSFDE